MSHAHQNHEILITHSSETCERIPKDREYVLHCPHTAIKSTCIKNANDVYFPIYILKCSLYVSYHVRFQQKTSPAWLNKTNSIWYLIGSVIFSHPIMLAESFSEISHDNLYQTAFKIYTLFHVKIICAYRFHGKAYTSVCVCSKTLTSFWEIWASEISWFWLAWLYIRLITAIPLWDIDDDCTII